MQTVKFNIGGERQFLIPDGEQAVKDAVDIVQGRKYPISPYSHPSVVVDIGAHVGEFTIFAAIIWPHATVHAYEPYPPVFDVLERNLAPYPNVVLHPEAVASDGGTQKLFISFMGTLCNSLKEGPVTENCDAVEVPAIGPSDIAKLKPDVLKIDAEGVEWDIISALPLADIHTIYFEYHCEDHRRKICRLLDETHSMFHAEVHQPERGEMAYIRKSNA